MANPTLELSGEPEIYSATVVHIIEEGDRREVITTRVARLGEMYREDWTGAGERRAIIFRPDLGKSFLLYLDRNVYMESAIDDQPQTVDDETKITLDRIDKAFNAANAPLEVETKTLPDETIDGHICQVTERRERFDNGYIEMTRSFQAREFAGLALRVEQTSESPTARIKIVTERRDARTDVGREEFDIPSGFTKVDALR